MENFNDMISRKHFNINAFISNKLCKQKLKTMVGRL